MFARTLHLSRIQSVMGAGCRAPGTSSGLRPPSSRPDRCPLHPIRHRHRSGYARARRPQGSRARTAPRGRTPTWVRQAPRSSRRLSTSLRTTGAAATARRRCSTSAACADLGHDSSTNDTSLSTYSVLTALWPRPPPPPRVLQQHCPGGLNLDAPGFCARTGSVVALYSSRGLHAEPSYSLPGWDWALPLRLLPNCC